VHHPDRREQSAIECIVQAREPGHAGPRYHVTTATYLEWKLFFYGTLDRHIHHWLSSNVKPHDITVDVGANFGFFSLIMAVSGHECHAFEPVGHLANRLMSNVSLNEQTNVRCVRAALSNRAGSATFYLPSGADANRGTGGLRLNRGGGTITVPTLRLDDYADDNRLQGAHVIKVDVEGAEDLVIEGGLGVIARYRPALIVEWNQGSVSRVFDLLGPLHYDCIGFDGRRLTTRSSPCPTDALFLPRS
jgi:FkbM family methyltransferase